jgi:hypothetical protein
MAKFPEPPKRLIVPPATVTLGKGERVWRIYFQPGPHPTA